MAYGKIKADTFVYDNSGSDVEVTLASLGNKADLASPTFTGTVTIPTPSSGDNTTKAASTAFVVAGFTAKPASAGTVAASEVVQVDANKDTTGIRNLTISGNLQVNGTTTTVASSTMTVTDKNIEIAKGAANDAAADGAGITVDSGDGDKTWNWVDATDSWTSNQKIEATDVLKVKSTTSESNIQLQNDARTWKIVNYDYGTGADNLGFHDGAGDRLIIDHTTGNTSITGSLTTSGTHNYLQSSSNSLATLTLKKSAAAADALDYMQLRDSSNALKYKVGSTGNVEANTVNANTFTSAGSVIDSKGDVRNIPVVSKSAAYTLVAADAGKCIVTDSNVTIPNSTIGGGDAVTIVNNSGSDITITASIGTLYNTADAATGNRTLAARGMATILFMSGGTAAYISGAGLS